MKKILPIFVVILAIAAPSWADGPSVTVQNQETWRFWYLLDPPGFADEEPGSSWLAVKASGFFAKVDAEFPFILLESGESVTFDGLVEGTHFLLGFFEDDSLEEFPVRLITLQVDSSMESRHYDVYSLPELLLADRGQGMLARFARPAETVVAAEAPVAEEAAVEVVVAEAVTESAVAEVVAEVAAEPAAEEVVEESAVEEPVVAEAAAEPAVAEVVTEEAVSEVVEETVAEEPAAEAVVAEVAAEPAAEEVVAEAAVEPAAEEVVAEEPVAEALVEEPVAEEQIVAAAEEPAAAVTEEPFTSEELATFAESYDPVYFTRESRGSFVVQPIASSRAWGRPGTRLSSFTGSLADGTLTVTLRSPDGFAENVSCFFYVFPERHAGGASKYTFEARPETGGRAAVVLWQQGRAVPRLIGTALTIGGEFTWTVRADELPPELAQGIGPATTFDLTTAWLDETSGTWEEFYFTTFAVADLTR